MDHLKRWLPLVVITLLFGCSPPPPPLPEAALFNRIATTEYSRQEVKLAEIVAKWARSVNREPPTIDANLTHVCRNLARQASQKGAQSIAKFTNSEIQAELVHFGVSDSAIRTQMAAFFSFATLDNSIGAQVRDELSRGRYTHFGLGVVQGWLPPMLYATLLLTRRPVALDPFPKRVQVGERVLLSGILLEGLKEPAIYYSSPSGQVHKVLIHAATDGSFRSHIFFGHGPGLYRLEVSGVGSGGPEIAALMPILAGDAEYPPPAKPGQPVATIEEARQLIFARINRERRQQGFAPLETHLILQSVAQSHAEEMQQLRYALHNSPTTGMVSDRVTAVGLNWRRVGENVAINQTALAAHTGLMNSPAHRANVLDKEVNLVGIGVAISDNGHGQRAVYLVENFLSMQ